MTYTAVLKDEDRFLYIYEGDVYMGYLHDFTTVNIAKAFQDAINGVIPLNIASELFAEVDFVNEEDGGYYTIFIGDADDAWCFVGGCGHEEALELAEALVKQIKEQEGEAEPTTRDEFLQALREAWGDVQNHKTHILHDFSDFFKDELGEE